MSRTSQRKQIEQVKKGFGERLSDFNIDIIKGQNPKFKKELLSY